MPLLLLIRHGENEYVEKGRLAGRLPGVHLNQKGREQAQDLADKLAQAPIKAIYSSPLERAIETASPLANALKLEIIPCEGLQETDYGEWQGQTLKGLRRLKLWRSVQHSPSLVRFPGGESFAECQFRVCQAIQSISAQYEEKDLIALVFHADPIKLAVAFFIGLPLDNFQRLSSSPCSVTALQMNEQGCQLFTLNYAVSFSFPKP
jgi:probable phosphomutase (TIGR03848 family)